LGNKCARKRGQFKEEKIMKRIKNIFYFVNLMYDYTFFLVSIKLLDGCYTQSGIRDPGGNLKGSFSRTEYCLEGSSINPICANI
jgi:hypothetical protein